MQERERPGEGDIRGPGHGDFTDWDNAEDEEWEEPSEGYDEGAEDSYFLTPDDPDYDLSEAASYAEWEPPQRRFMLPQWLIVAFSLLMILVLLLPLLLRLS